MNSAKTRGNVIRDITSILFDLEHCLMLIVVDCKLRMKWNKRKILFDYSLSNWSQWLLKIHSLWVKSSFAIRILSHLLIGIFKMMEYPVISEWCCVWRFCSDCCVIKASIFIPLLYVIFWSLIESKRWSKTFTSYIFHPHFRLNVMTLWSRSLLAIPH